MTLSQKGLNPSAATLLVGSQVSGGNGTTDSGGGSHSLDMSKVQRGRVMLGEITPYQKHIRRVEDRQEKREYRGVTCLFYVDSFSIQRSESQSTLLSMQSAGSYDSTVRAFSDASADVIHGLQQALRGDCALNRSVTSTLSWLSYRL